MGRGIVRVAAGAAIAAVVLLAVFLFGMRMRVGVVLDGVRRFNRAVTNPRVMRSAGSPGASASVIRHVGRRSGRSYETPVGPFPVGSDFVIALPYGPDADWVRNVMANGAATLVHDGRVVEVHEPVIVPTAEILEHLPAPDRRTLRLFGVRECLRVSPAPGELEQGRA